MTITTLMRPSTTNKTNNDNDNDNNNNKQNEQ